MNYKFLAKEEIIKLFEDSELSAVDIVDVLHLTKIKLESKKEKVTDKTLYEAIKVVSEDILSDSIIEDDKEWKQTVNRVFKIIEDEQK